VYGVFRHQCSTSFDVNERTTMRNKYSCKRMQGTSIVLSGEESMAIKVRIPTPLQKLTNGRSEVECAAKNITELVDALENGLSGMKERLSEGGQDQAGSSISM